MDYTQYKKLDFRRKFFKLFGASINVTDPATDAQVGYIQMQAFKLREDIRLYSSPDKTRELLKMHARSVIDFGVTFDVSADGNDVTLFSFRRQGLKSAFLRDSWQILDANETLIGTLQETSSGLALLRRYTDLIPFVGWAIDLAMAFFPITYTIYDPAKAVAGTIVQHRNPIIVKMSLDTEGAAALLDPRIPVAATSLLSIMDANKN